MEVLFVAVSVVLATFIVLGIFTRKGRNLAIGTAYRAKVIDDLGVVNQNGILLGRQKVTLIKCLSNDKKEEFYILETRSNAPLSIQFHFTRINEAMINSIKSKINH